MTYSLPVIEDARRILRQVNEAMLRAGRVARGQAGVLRVGFTENTSWYGVAPESFRQFRQRQPDAELQLNPLSTMEQKAPAVDNAACRA